jgi:hypothetical protein
VAQKANYSGTCKSGAEASEKWISVGNYSSIPAKISKGFTITVTFTNGNTAENLLFHLWDGSSSNSKEFPVINSPAWNAGETLSFVYNGEAFVMTSLSSSSVT